MSVVVLGRFGIRRTNVRAVTVSGFRRSFSQEPSRRKGVGNKRGVLTVSPSDEASMSAVLISEVSRSALAALDERELGYDRVGVRESRVQPFGDSRFDMDHEDVFIYVGKPHRFNSELEPNIDYLKLCIHAAADWGEVFHETFLNTTFVLETPLTEYAESAPRHGTSR